MNVLLLISGSISVKLYDKLNEKLQEHGHDVHMYMTSNANFLYNKLTDKQKYCSYDRADETAVYKESGIVKHISEVEWADVCLLAPADFNIIGKISNGIADDFVTSILAAYLGSGKKLFIADAMNTYMWLNPIYQKNRNTLLSFSQVDFIQPTVKALACGTTGIGALADLSTIVNIIEGHKWIRPIYSCTVSVDSFKKSLPVYGEPGYFGAQRKFDRHEGVDIYCKLHENVYAVEDGKVVDSYQYTGSKETGDWWNPTWCIKVQGKSGVVTYGELEMPNVAQSMSIQYPIIGTDIKAGTFIGIVGQVLKDEKLRHDIRNHSCSMLHLELRKENCHLDGWNLDAQRDKRLLDPMPYFLSKNFNNE